MTCNHDDVWVTQHADHITWEWKGDTGYALVQREVMELLLARCNEPTYAAGVQAAREAVAAMPHEDCCCSKGCACQTWDKPEPCDLSCNCSFWWMEHALAAIDALRGESE